MRISDWSSDVCSSDLTGRGEVRHRLSVGLDPGRAAGCGGGRQCPEKWNAGGVGSLSQVSVHAPGAGNHRKHLLSSAQSSGRGEVCEQLPRSEKHTSELQSLMRISYAVFCLKKKKC